MSECKAGSVSEETSEQTVQSSVNSSVEHFRHKGGRKMAQAAEENFEDVDEYRFYEKKSNQQIFVVIFVLLILYVKRNSIKKYLK